MQRFNFLAAVKRAVKQSATVVPARRQKARRAALKSEVMEQRVMRDGTAFGGGLVVDGSAGDDTMTVAFDDSDGVELPGHEDILASMQQELAQWQTQLNEADAHRQTAQDNLDNYQASLSWYERIIDDAHVDGLQAEIADAEQQIETLQGIVSVFQTEIENRRFDFERFEDHRELDAIAADSTLNDDARNRALTNATFERLEKDADSVQGRGEDGQFRLTDRTLFKYEEAINERSVGGLMQVRDVYVDQLRHYRGQLDQMSKMSTEELGELGKSLIPTVKEVKDAYDRMNQLESQSETLIRGEIRNGTWKGRYESMMADAERLKKKGRMQEAEQLIAKANDTVYGAFLRQRQEYLDLLNENSLLGIRDDEWFSGSAGTTLLFEELYDAFNNRQGEEAYADIIARNLEVAKRSIDREVNAATDPANNHINELWQYGGARFQKQRDLIRESGNEAIKNLMSELEGKFGAKAAHDAYYDGIKDTTVSIISAGVALVPVVGQGLALGFSVYDAADSTQKYWVADANRDAAYGSAAVTGFDVTTEADAKAEAEGWGAIESIGALGVETGFEIAARRSPSQSGVDQPASANAPAHSNEAWMDADTVITPQQTPGWMDAETVITPQQTPGWMDAETVITPQQTPGWMDAETVITPQQTPGWMDAETVVTPQQTPGWMDAETVITPQQTPGWMDAETVVPPQQNPEWMDAETVVPPQQNPGWMDAETVLPPQQNPEWMDAETVVPPQQGVEFREAPTEIDLPSASQTPDSVAMRSELETHHTNPASDEAIEVAVQPVEAVAAADASALQPNGVIVDQGTEYPIPFGDEVARSGATSSVHHNANWDGTVIRTTKTTFPEGRFAEIADEFGRRTLETRFRDSDAIGVVERHRRFDGTVDGQRASVEIVDLAQQGDARRIFREQGGFTQQQLDMLAKAKKELNDAGFAWIDDHPGNFTFDPETNKVIVLDPGGIVPVTHGKAAELQEAVDSVTEMMDRMLRGEFGERFRKQATQLRADEIMTEFEEFIDHRQISHDGASLSSAREVGLLPGGIDGFELRESLKEAAEAASSPNVARPARPNSTGNQQSVDSAPQQVAGDVDVPSHEVELALQPADDGNIEAAQNWESAETVIEVPQQQITNATETRIETPANETDSVETTVSQEAGFDFSRPILNAEIELAQELSQLDQVDPQWDDEERETVNEERQTRLVRRRPVDGFIVSPETATPDFSGLDFGTDSFIQFDWSTPTESNDTGEMPLWRTATPERQRQVASDAPVESDPGFTVEFDFNIDGLNDEADNGFNFEFDIDMDIDWMSDDMLNQLMEDWDDEELLEEEELEDEDFVDPLVLDLNGNGKIDLTTAENGHDFDIAGNGQVVRTATATNGDGLLALDLNGNGRIDDGTELFGDQNGAADGFAELSLYDDNGDGVIDATDAVFSELSVFEDLNLNGQTDAGELRKLTEYGITEIRLNAQQTNEEVNGNRLVATSSFVRTDGSEGQVADALFRVLNKA